MGGGLIKLTAEAHSPEGIEHGAKGMAHSGDRCKDLKI